MDTDAEVKELIQDFVLITYDIPAYAKSLRRKFLKEASAMGAEMYTESVYLCPLSEKTMTMANELESAGHAVIWLAHMPDEATAMAINMKYEDAVKNRCKSIRGRLAVMQNYISSGWLKRAQNMGIKTGKMLKELSTIYENYEKAWLKEELDELKAKWEEIYDA
jgi:CRISPR-associated endonuclease Cas2